MSESHGDEPMIAADAYHLRRDREDIEADKAVDLPPVLCVDCKHFARPAGEPYPNYVHGYGKCDHPSNLFLSPVDGSEQRQHSDYAITIRLLTQHCGPDGKWWRAK